MLRAALIWGALLLALVVPVVFAVQSPLLEWRQPVYVAAGLAGVLGMGAILLQPLLVGGVLPGLAGRAGRQAHRWGGALLVASVIVHVAGLWVTSPPDVIDALTFTSPTLFTPFGVIAMWAVFAAACLAVLRKRLPLRAWRLAHSALVVLAVIGTVVHAALIEGTMEPVSKTVLGALALLATARVLIRLRAWNLRARPARTP